MSEPVSRSRNHLRKAPKLRASCDACSSAKVRCTQSKPSCARCTKHDVPCVYGISRRSGKRSAESYQAMRKNAEMEMANTPVEGETLDTKSIRHSKGHDAQSSSVINMELLNSPSNVTTGLPTPPIAMSMDFLDSPASLDFPDSPCSESLESTQDQYPSSPDPCPDLPDYLKQQLKDWAFDNMFMQNMLPTPEVSPKTSSCPSMFDLENPDLNIDHEYAFPEDDTSQCFKPSSIYSQSPVSEPDFAAFSTSRRETDNLVPSIENENYFNHPQPQRQPRQNKSDSSNCKSCTTHPNQAASDSSSKRSCHCNENIISHLSLSPKSQSPNNSYDMSLAQLQETLKLGSDVLGCSCSNTDPSIPISLSLLAARIVSVLERLCRRAIQDESATPAQDQMSFDGNRFSLGMYQIAKEDERRLKEEMLGIQIKKAELLVLCCREVVSRSSVKDMQSVVSDKLFSFLGEQVGVVKREWNSRNGD